MKRWMMCLKSNLRFRCCSVVISGGISHIRGHPEEAKPLWPSRHWYLLVAPYSGPQRPDVLH